MYQVKILCLLASCFCLVFAVLIFFVEGSAEAGFLLAFLALVFAWAAILNDGTIRRFLLWLSTRN
jgi:hypothetical protein